MSGFRSFFFIFSKIFCFHAVTFYEYFRPCPSRLWRSTERLTHTSIVRLLFYFFFVLNHSWSILYIQVVLNAVSVSAMFRRSGPPLRKTCLVTRSHGTFPVVFEIVNEYDDFYFDFERARITERNG